MSMIAEEPAAWSESPEIAWIDTGASRTFWAESLLAVTMISPKPVSAGEDVSVAVAARPGGADSVMNIPALIAQNTHRYPGMVITSGALLYLNRSRYCRGKERAGFPAETHARGATCRPQLACSPKLPLPDRHSVCPDDTGCAAMSSERNQPGSGKFPSARPPDPVPVRPRRTSPLSRCSLVAVLV